MGKASMRHFGGDENAAGFELAIMSQGLVDGTVAQL